MLNVPWFNDGNIVQFPPTEQALSSPDGLLALGGNLSATTLVNAYRCGIFPWFEDEQPIMWWSPSVRAVIPTAHIHIGKNTRKLLKQKRYVITADTVFAEVIDACSDREATWITESMREAYLELHQQEIAHSIEVFDTKNELVGGLYGVFVRNCFCGESMFSRHSNTSKLALTVLAQFLLEKGCRFIDCQLPTAHLHRMGAMAMQRERFITTLMAMSDNIHLANQLWTKIWQPY